MGIALLFSQLVLCVFMTGLIWTIQILHYPAFADVGEESFVAFHAKHSWRITWIVAPTMLLELLTAGWLVVVPQGSLFFVANFIGVVALWSCTFFLSIPLHNSLARGKDLAEIHRLVQTNWPRTFLWSLRTVLLSFYFFEILPAGISPVP